MTKKQEAERLFYQDVHSKKRTGSGAFSRTGKGKKHGIKGGMKLPYDQLSRKEKKEYMKPSEVRSYNMNDVLPKEEFLKRSKKEQKELLERWRDLYKNTEIKKKMGVSDNVYYGLLDELNIKRPSNRYEQSVIPFFLLKEYKINVPDYETFMQIDSKQQFYLMWGVYDKRYEKKLAKLAEELGTNKNNVYSLREKLKQWAKKNGLKIDQVVREIEEETKKRAIGAAISGADEVAATADEVAATTVEAVEESVKYEENLDEVVAAVEVPETPTALEEERDNDQLLMSLEGSYSGDVLSKRLKKISDFLMGEGNQFEIQLTLKEIPNSGDEEEGVVDEKEETLKKVLELLMNK